MNKNIPRYLKIDGSPNLVRDTFSMGIINNDSIALNNAIKRREEALKKVSEQRDMKCEINTLKKDLEDLRNLVSALIK